MVNLLRDGEGGGKGEGCTGKVRGGRKRGEKEGRVEIEDGEGKGRKCVYKMSKWYGHKKCVARAHEERQCTRGMIVSCTCTG